MAWIISWIEQHFQTDYRKEKGPLVVVNHSGQRLTKLFFLGRKFRSGVHNWVSDWPQLRACQSFAIWQPKGGFPFLFFCTNFYEVNTDQGAFVSVKIVAKMFFQFSNAAVAAAIIIVNRKQLSENISFIIVDCYVIASTAESCWLWPNFFIFSCPVISVIGTAR